ncbi:hypothetical protein GBAR_LOCUS15553 [Geodia barretti]|uniref:Uncharacterized protein n=1 Tax=Geodia barretti TaxID=519541 RepID=A0AA35WUL8_GEOBA|nr:hypothetical protein GBAR_LOCUS15553 [Geodia barretti]
MGVRERVLCDTDCPWKSLQDLRKQSLTFSNLQRYFLRHREGGVTSIYMCNVDKEILREKAKYTEFVKSLFAEIPAYAKPSENQMCLIKIGPAFPSAGGLFLEFPTFDLAIRITSALENLQSCPKIILLPTIHPDAVGLDQEPLLVFVNRKSGGNQGVKLISGFRRHINPHQVVCVAPHESVQSADMWGRRDLRLGSVGSSGHEGVPGLLLSALRRPASRDRCVREGGEGVIQHFHLVNEKH